jgi:hypothetical protein
MDSYDVDDGDYENWLYTKQHTPFYQILKAIKYKQSHLINLLIYIYLFDAFGYVSQKMGQLFAAYQPPLHCLDRTPWSDWFWSHCIVSTAESKTQSCSYPG